jgi:hypothetical protein
MYEKEFTMAINAIHSNMQFPVVIQHQVKNSKQQGDTKETYIEDNTEDPQSVALQAALSTNDFFAAKAEAAKQEVAAAKSAVLENNSNLASVIALSFAYIGKQNIDAKLDLAEAIEANMEKDVAKP